MISWYIKVTAFRKKTGKEYPRISLPSEFRFLIGKQLKLTLVDENKLLLEWDDPKR